jgi:hypothetical protein
MCEMLYKWINETILLIDKFIENNQEIDYFLFEDDDEITFLSKAIYPKNTSQTLNNKMK